MLRDILHDLSDRIASQIEKNTPQSTRKKNLQVFLFYVKCGIKRPPAGLWFEIGEKLKKTNDLAAIK
ncbi:hypothetical protein A8139_08345 [Marinomonas primoryensis]|jgi:hypothetical protein|uniref:Uncharacterized protein n=1 Tax=Marinomonas primoryensis TaxID=178399 RepID=A0A2Z4PRA9_9GAMM|nr:hypothetical protein A8139_08345 [Marinomonas primoryensis]|tara:strand:+ start:122 stop:322 length:201 start_codon:yes stop_codon:yes gene_type:complete